MLNRATQFASKTWSIPIANLELSLEEIVGGLESRVARAIFRSSKAKEVRRTNTFVVKELRGLQRRETTIYRELWTRSPLHQLSDSWELKRPKTLTIYILRKQLRNRSGPGLKLSLRQQCVEPWHGYMIVRSGSQKP